MNISTPLNDYDNSNAASRRSFRVVRGDLDRISESASPEAIHAWLIKARRNLYAAQAEVEWLEALLERRMAERAAGTWPVSLLPAPGMTDLMVSPESIDVCIAENPPPRDSREPIEIVLDMIRMRDEALYDACIDALGWHESAKLGVEA